MVALKELPSESMVMALSFLRATDLASVREVDKTIFSAQRVHGAIVLLLEEVYNLPLPAAPKRGTTNSCTSSADFLYRPDFLYVKEISSILFVLSAPQPVSGKGFWVSTSWLGNAKKYMEALPLPELERTRKSPAKKKLSRIRARRGSDALPPWPMINSEITCEHGGLRVVSRGGVKGRRRTMESRYWHFLRRFYPDGQQFKCARSPDCVLCASSNAEAIASAAEKRVAEVSTRKNDLVPPALNALLLRKCGVPLDCVTSRVAYFTENSDSPPTTDLQDHMSLSMGQQQQQGMLHESPSDGSLVRHLHEMTAYKSDSSCDGNSPAEPASPVARSVHVSDSNVPLTPYSSDFAIAYSTTGVMHLPVENNEANSSTNTDAAMSASILQSESYYQQAMSGGMDSAMINAMFSSPPQLLAPAAEEEFSSAQQPLIAGHYNVVPKKWLKAWRRFVKDASVTTLPALDCTSLLCSAHRQFVLPPHLQEYLLCMRKTLLNGLGVYPGEIIEVLSADEWDALQEALPCQAVADCSVRFALDGENVLWNVGVCEICDPFSFDPISRNTRKTSRNPHSASPKLYYDATDVNYC